MNNEEDALDKIERAKTKYFHSNKGRNAIRKYLDSGAGKASLQKYFSSEKGKASQLKYYLSEKGKTSREQRLQLDNLLLGLSTFLANNPGKTVEDFLQSQQGGKNE